MARRTADYEGRVDANREPKDAGPGEGVVLPTVVSEKRPGKQAQRQPKAPTIEQIEQWAREDEAFWRERNLRQEQDQDLYDLVWRSAPPGEVLFYTNDPAAYVRKLTGLMARKKYRIDVPARGRSQTAQRIENACRHWDAVMSREHVKGLRPPMQWARCLSLFLRGWIAERTMLDPDSEHLVSDVLFDPYTVYPRLTGNGLQHVTHAYEATIDELRETFPEAAKRWKGMDGDKVVRCVAYYGNREPYYHAIVAEGGWVKRPAALGYWPWQISIAESRISPHAVGMARDYLRSGAIGTGILQTIRGMIANVETLLTSLGNAAAKQENPPLIVQPPDGQVYQVELKPGTQNTIPVGSKVDIVDVGAKIATLLPLLQTFQDRIDKGSIPASLFGMGGSGDSGFLRALEIGAANDILMGYVDCLALHQVRRFETFLDLYGRFADKPFEYVSKGAKGLARGQRGWGEQMTARDIEQNGTFVEVTYEDISPQDRVALGQLAAMLNEKRLVSRKKAQEKYLGEDDPEQEQQQILAEEIYGNPEAVKVMTRAALKRLGLTDELKALDQVTQPQPQPEQVPGPQGMQAAPPVPPEVLAMLGQMGQPGQPGAVLPGQMPTGLPPEVLPPEMAGMVEAVPTDEELAAQGMLPPMLGR
jgi:hypothetical protein